MVLKDSIMKSIPIFIIGAPRSGTTLLRLILSAHSTISIPHEFTLVENVISYFKEEVITQKRVLQFLSEQYKISHFLDWQIDRTLLTSKVTQSTYTQSEIIDLIYRTYIEVHSPTKTTWGDKNINSLTFIPAIVSLFPEARFIHIVRDGRDVAASLQSRRWKFYTLGGSTTFFIKHFRGAMLTWVSAINTIKKSLEVVPKSSQITIKYEDLIGETERSIMQLCEFLKIDFEEGILHYYDKEEKKPTISKKRLKGTHENTTKPILADNKAKYLNFYSKYQIACIEKIGRLQLQSNSYALESELSSSKPIFLGLTKLSYHLKFAFYWSLYRLKQSFKRLIS